MVMAVFGLTSSGTNTFGASRWPFACALEGPSSGSLSFSCSRSCALALPSRLGLVLLRYSGTIDGRVTHPLLPASQTSSPSRWSLKFPSRSPFRI